MLGFAPEALCRVGTTDDCTIWHREKQMKKLVLALLLTASPASAAPGGVAGHCEEEARGNWARELYCLRLEYEAHQRVLARGYIEPSVLDHCNRKSDTWAMLDYCLRSVDVTGSRSGRSGR